MGVAFLLFLEDHTSDDATTKHRLVPRDSELVTKSGNLA
jgi:hypothetical protein